MNRLLVICLMFVANIVQSQDFFIGRLKYGGGGDWYSNPSSINNLMKFIEKNTGVDCAEIEKTVTITENISSFPYLYLTGHGTIDMNEEEIKIIRKHLLSGGFLHADDNYGLDVSFRKLVKKIFPNKELLKVPFDHPIYSIKYKFPKGLPKVHKHNDKNPEGLGIFHDGRLILFYSYESDLGDGWEDEEVHNDPQQKRLAALKMGCNLSLYYLIGQN